MKNVLYTLDIPDVDGTERSIPITEEAEAYIVDTIEREEEMTTVLPDKEVVEMILANLEFGDDDEIFEKIRNNELDFDLNRSTMNDSYSDLIGEIFGLEDEED